MGDTSICEHGGEKHRADSRSAKFLVNARSTELQRFRSSFRKTRECPVCGYHNPESDQSCCQNTLILVEYHDPMVLLPPTHRHFQRQMSLIQSRQEAAALEAAALGTAAPDDVAGAEAADGIDGMPQAPAPPPPAPAGHGARGPGGHYTGRCLCSPTGCPIGAVCLGYHNPLTDRNMSDHFAADTRNFALVSVGHLHGTSMSNMIFTQNVQVGDQVFVEPQPATRRVDEAEEAFEMDVVAPPATPGSPTAQSAGGSPRSPRSPRPSTRKAYRKQLAAAARGPALWQDGVYGGAATVRQWKFCGRGGGRGYIRGKDVLPDQDWRISHEDACVMLLKEDGSTGLDLSFATHIFLLNHIRDPALEDQISG